MGNFFDSLAGTTALPVKDELHKLWQSTAHEVIPTFTEFADLLSEIGVASWRVKDERYGFADIYVYGFKMNRAGTK